MAERSSERSASGALVIGVRSIGTSLSAVVRAALADGGWDARRLTVRPSGHPYDRHVELAPGQVGGARHAIIVDEGPGMSGSSMAATAKAAVAAGIDAARLSFFPGHGGEPGGAASPEVRRWWQDTPRCVVPTGQLRWNGRSLPERLREETTRLLNGVHVERVEDLSGGLWRHAATGRTNASLPPAFPAFERTKYRCVLGDGRSVLWKFAGLGGGADRLMQQMASRAAGGWTPAPLGTSMGFIAIPWVEGQLLDRTGVNDEVLVQVGRYIALAAGMALTPEEQPAGFGRLREMLYWNTWEALGAQTAEATRSVSESAWRVFAEQPMSAYGDGRLGPYEWVRTPAGQIVKVDCAGHDADHTVIGKQPLMWDVAGAVVEWALEAPGAKALQAAAGLERIPRDLSVFYHASYAAFRVGMAAMCGVDAAHYRDLLERLLRQDTGMGTCPRHPQ
jgi:hypothetical protein